MTNARRLNLGAVSLVRGRVRNDIQIMTVVRDDLEPVLDSSGWFLSAPFSSIGLILRYGTRTNLTPVFQGIHESTGELQLAVELNMEDLRSASGEPLRLESLVRNAICATLYAIADKYALSKAAIEAYGSRHNDA